MKTIIHEDDDFIIYMSQDKGISISVHRKTSDGNEKRPGGYILGYNHLVYDQEDK